MTVEFAGQKKSAKAGTDGKWLTKLGSLEASFESRAMVITDSTGRKEVLKDTHLITCFADWNGQGATKAVPEALAEDVGLYGFAKPSHSRNGTINLDRILPMRLSELSGNTRNIAVLARACRGNSIDSVWDGKGFVEPGSPPPFRIKFRGRKGWSGTAPITHDGDKSIITKGNPEILCFEYCNGQIAR